MLEKMIEDYRKGVMSEDDFITESFKYHSELINYRKLLHESGGVQKIELRPDGVFLQIGKNDIHFYMKLNQGSICDVPTLVLNFGAFEPEELEMVMKIVAYMEKGSVFFDIGANLGWYSLNLLSNYPDCRCYSFEPVRETFDRMVENFMCNRFDTARVFNFGFYNESVEKKFFYNKEESGASSLANLRGNEATVEIVCEMRRLDDFVMEEGVDRLDFIKCDVEGSELFVYQGGKNTIKKYKPVIFSEMLRKWCRKFEYHPNDIIAMMNVMDYECFVITGSKWLARIEEVTEETVETNYFFLHKEKHKKIIEELTKV